MQFLSMVQMNKANPPLFAHVFFIKEYDSPRIAAGFVIIFTAACVSVFVISCDGALRRVCDKLSVKVYIFELIYSQVSNGGEMLRHQNIIHSIYVSFLYSNVTNMNVYKK